MSKKNYFIILYTFIYIPDVVERDDWKKMIQFLVVNFLPENLHFDNSVQKNYYHYINIIKI